MSSAEAVIPLAKRSPLGRFADVLYRRPNLYLLLLLVPPLLWFGSVYIASLLSLLWQGFYTFDDFTLLVERGRVRMEQWEMPLEIVALFCFCSRDGGSSKSSGKGRRRPGYLLP